MGRNKYPVTGDIRSIGSGNETWSHIFLIEGVEKSLTSLARSAKINMKVKVSGPQNADDRR